MTYYFFIIFQYNETEFSLWDRFELTLNEKGEELTLQEFMDYFQVRNTTFW